MTYWNKCTYRRWDEEGDFYVVLNFSDESNAFQLDNLSDYELAIGNYKEGGASELQPWEGRVYRKNQRFI